MSAPDTIPKPKPHPIYFTIKSQKIPILRIAHAIGSPFSSVYFMLTGYLPMRPDVEQKLAALLRRVEKEAQK